MNWLGYCRTGALVLVLSHSGVVYPCTLEQLLALPFEQLLQLSVVPHRAVPVDRGGR
ncbi:MAG: hypothetical protein RLZZ373_3464 [Pseudomonadota bacterium]|jgi:hypothetical protein